MAGGGGEGATLEYTPTWVVAAVCTVIVAISLAMERLLHYVGNILKKKQQKPLFEALLKVKEELMLLGFISLLLTVFQSAISKICISREALTSMLPCKIEDNKEPAEGFHVTPTTSHFQKYFAFTLSGGTRRLLAEASTSSQMGYCGKKGKVPLLSVQALHHLHIFIFVLAIVHVTFCVLTVSFGGLRIHQWKRWEDSIEKENYDAEQVLKKTVTHVHQHAFIKEHFKGFGKDSTLLGWLTHCRGNPKFNFHKYMIRALEDDFKQVVGISWYLWLFVVIFLLLNINGWHTYFWLAFIPFILLLAVGTKLEHVIIQLAHEVAEKHIAIEGELVVQPSDEHFWFKKPRIVLFLIHFILFQNAFEIAFFFWIWVQFGFDSCIMGEVCYIIPRLLIGVFVQVLCSYSTLPLYAIVTQMGSSFKKAIFDEHVQASLVGWAQKAKKKTALKAATEGTAAQASPEEAPFVAIQMGRIPRNASDPE
ncbi:MLO-like protein 1 isoform X2 [Durio zibethinus]|uniref:MLO-like protein n=1 Tax=Durio zibethinus TaxID=66656 RepID=A0A6P5WWR7_DURZI|nr:MLO-like protein 1 isoform X2 [Durio zibethinus]